MGRYSNEFKIELILPLPQGKPRETAGRKAKGAKARKSQASQSAKGIEYALVEAKQQEGDKDENTDVFHSLYPLPAWL